MTETPDPTRANHPDATDRVAIGVPAGGLILLVGVSGSGKSTFARAHFRPTEVISSDFCRGLVADDENDQNATADAFDVLHYIVGTRLRRGLLTVVDATNVQAKARAELVALAKRHHVLVDAIVLDVPESVAAERTAARADRNFGRDVIKRQLRDLHRTLSRAKREGFRRVHVLRGVDRISATDVIRERSWNDRTDLHGPFDIIGDVHGCASELRTLLTDLGWQIEHATAADGHRTTVPVAIGATHPEGRTAVFVGDLVDRGPDITGSLRLVMGMVAAGTALCVAGNHEVKLVRALDGRKVRIAHGLEESLTQLAAEPPEFTRAARDFMAGLISHYVLDGGKLVVAHAGLKEAYHGRTSARVRAFALYGDTTGETDEYGLPVRLPWAKDYRGDARVVFGHTPTPTAEWLNNTICIDTGCVFGGALTALRYPELELVTVPAEQEWYAPTRPLAPPAQAESDGRESSVLHIDDVLGARWLEAPRAGKVKIPEENAAAALEVMSRFAVDPRWLIYLPPTMSPSRASTLEGWLERPEEAFAEYANWGVSRVVCEEKHMGSRAIAVIARDPGVAERRFGIADGSSGSVFTRTGRPFFPGPAGATLVARVRDAILPLFTALDTDWVALDCELLPWSAKAGGLIRSQYAAVGAAARAALPVALDVLQATAARGLDADAHGAVATLAERSRRRLANAEKFRDAYAAYCRPTDGLAGVTLAPFQILAVEGHAPAITEPHEWHLAELARLDSPFLTPTRHVFVDLTSATEKAAAVDWWLDLTASGGEGMVVKPAGMRVPDLPVGRARGGQAGLKVRGREYLRIVYGPDYLESLDVLRKRQLGKKRHLAEREHALGLDALEGFVAGEPLWKVHQRVFAVLAMESEAVDPRL
ncbi:polynucleotide kinase-phosphatase [Granulicoccus sp. GXG6511]|uniref:polynucleotide kinase-phosphatase n=1 Tax=Granulicoccus sp. GXG6511 TaxID=3381351 RepID=UPI003D7E85DB